MYLQITTKCNMHCDHCGMAATATGQVMSLKTYRAALRLCQNYGDQITLGGGEPTIHPRFEQFLVEAIAAADSEAGVWLATNGKHKRRALLCAKLARAGVIGCDLSQDDWHEPIDPEVVEAFTIGKKPRQYYDRDTDDQRHIRTVTRLVNAGRCDFGEPGCICEDWFIRPNGSIHQCGCADSPEIGTVFDYDILNISGVPSSCCYKNIADD